MFHWFGVSVYNVARLAGFVRGLAKKEFTRADLQDASRFNAVRASVNAYVKSLPELAAVLVWRHKVGAHFAITAPQDGDNIATLDMSVTFPVTFTNGRYYVGELVMMQKNHAGIFTSEIPTWSVTEVFEAIIPRYWPHVTIVPAPMPAEEPSA